VLGWTHRCGQLHLILVLPDGSRSLIPATWTDFEGGVTVTGRPHHTSLATLPDLLQARAVVDALLRRLPLPGRDHRRLTQRRAIVQLSLNLQDVPVPEARVWETLDDDQRALVIEILARLFAKAAAPPVAEEELRDE
jgi:hypothetical protein